MYIDDGFYINVGGRVKKRRLELKLTREGLALMADISEKFIYDIEKGKKGMSAETLYKIKSSLNVSADWLLDGIAAENVTADGVVIGRVTDFYVCRALVKI